MLGQGDTEPAVAVGSTLRAPRTGDSYAMFYLFSMKEQQATLDLVRQALLFGGLAMVLMVGGVAWLVSRQVLNPVRLARRIAERYASGSLEQRMHVSGEDDIARLSTSFNQMAASLQSQIRRLENLSRLQQRFVSDVSHELRTPLTTVQMASSLLFEARERFDPQTARSAELLKSELDRFEELLSNLLDLSRFDAGAARLELDAVDLAAIARAAADDPLLQRQGIEVRLVGTDEPAIVEADIRRIDRIVRNLLTNAAKYSGSPVVEIEVVQDEEHVSLAVRDFGVGLSGDENLRVFDRFWRADPAGPRAAPGSGCRSRGRTPCCTAAPCRPGVVRARAASSCSPSPRPSRPPTSRRTAAVGTRATRPVGLRMKGSLVAATVTTMLAGCAGIPSSGPVERVADDGGPDQSTVRYAPVGPPRGASPQQIVRGYLDAMLAYPVSTGTAALYLTPDAAKQWRSSDGVTVYASPRVTLPETGESPDADAVSVELRTDEVARLDRQGHYTRSVDDPKRTYRLERVDGQWRIANPQSGVMVTRTYYGSYFRPFSLYFFDASGERLVPDLVHLAVGEQLPTGLVTALARGPGRTPGTLRTYVPGAGSLRPSVTVGEGRGRRGVLDVTHQAVRGGARPAGRPDRVDPAVRARPARSAHLRRHRDPLVPGRAGPSGRLLGRLRPTGREEPHLRPRRRQARGDRRRHGAAGHGSVGTRRGRGRGGGGERRLRGRRARRT